MGTGWMEAEHERFGFPFPEMKTRVKWLAEQIEAVGRYWGDGPHLHLIVGGSGLSGTIGPAARFADEYNTVMASPEECTERREKLAIACEREGRAAIPLSLMTACAIGRDPAEARRANPPQARARRPSRSTPTSTRRIGAGSRSSAPPMKRPTSCGRMTARASRRVMLQHLDHRDLEMIALIGTELAPAVA